MWNSPSRRQAYWPPETRGRYSFDIVVGEGIAVAARGFGEHLLDADTFDARGGAGEILVDQRAIEADGLEDLGAAITLEGRDAHLGHDLEESQADGLDVLFVAFSREVSLIWPFSIISSRVSKAT